MPTQLKIKYFGLFTILILFYGAGLSFILVKASEWRLSKSREYLYEAKKTRDASDRLLLLEKSILLSTNAENTMYAGVTAVQLNQGGQAERYLAGISDIDTWMQVADLLDVSRETTTQNRVIKLVNYLRERGYPQMAGRVLAAADAKGLLTRDGYIELAKTQISTNDVSAAYTNLLKAKQLDPYYPQTYQQLVIVCEKLGKTQELKQYSELNSQLTF